ncbi:hypothetical protein [Phormidium sp. CCY1219]|nr:hypothetical protein [Phormidium sp. CCY1219]
MVFFVFDQLFPGIVPEKASAIASVMGQGWRCNSASFIGGFERK